MLHAVIDNALEISWPVARGKPRGPVLLKFGTELVFAVMVGPHQGELHPVPILRAKKPLLQGLLHGLHAAVPVPVVEKHVDAVVGGQVDLTGGPFRIALIEIAPCRLQRLGMAGKTGHRRLHPLPFRPTLAFPRAAVVVVVPVRIIDRDHCRAPCGAGLGRPAG